MASSNTELSQPHQQIRSFSLPYKLNPINRRIHEKLRSLRTKEESSTSTSEAISIGLSGIAELYECINEVLGLPITQQALSLREYEGCLGELLKACSSLLRVCISLREIVLHQKDIANQTELSIRDNGKESSSIERYVASYISSRKEVIKSTKVFILLVKKLEDESFSSEDYQLSTVVKALRCVSIINVSVCESLLCFLSKPVQKPKRSLVPKLMKVKGKEGARTGNELNDVEISLHGLISKEGADGDDKFRLALGSLKALVDVMEGIEHCLESVEKQLSETRTFLMNIVSF